MTNFYNKVCVSFRIRKYHSYSHSEIKELSNHVVSDLYETIHLLGNDYYLGDKK